MQTMRHWFGAALVVSCVLATSVAHAQERPRSDYAPRRAAVTYAYGIAAAASAIGLGAAVGMGMNRRCDAREAPFDPFAEAWECPMRGLSTGIITTAFLVPAATVAGTYVPHRRHGGTAPFWVAAVGTLSGTGAALLGVYGAMSATSGEHAERTLIPALIGAGMLTAAVPTLALEWSDRRHRRRRETAKETSRLSLMPSASALRDGVWVGLRGAM